MEQTSMEKNPTDMLEEEHVVIQRVVGLMAVLIQAVEAGRPVDGQVLADIVDFMRTFADRCHHGKEEVHLFPLLEAKGVPMQGCPLGALTAEHLQGRSLVRQLEQAAQAYAAGTPDAQEALAQTLHSLAELYPGHIWKEDYLLFPMTNKILSPEEQASLYERFQAVDREMGEDVYHRFDQLAAKLAERLSSA
jgi:hemerythrin-like domain-containing protein